MTTDMQFPLVNRREAAEILERGITTVSLAVEYGHLTPVGKLPGKTGPWLFNRADVEAYKSARDAKAALAAGPDKAASK